MQVSRGTARKLMIEKQGLTIKKKQTLKDDLFDTIDMLGCVQIDTINVVERAHYLTLWSRHGNYQKELLHTLAYVDHQLFEHWAHALCFIPFKDYRYYISQMERRKKSMTETFVKRSGQNPKLINQVYDRVVEEGPLSSSDFEGSRTGDGWGNWKPAKLALELLYRSGKLLVHHRINFKKYYDIAENIIPPNIDISLPSMEERIKYFLYRTLKALGLASPQEFRKYYHTQSLKLGTTKQLTEHLNKLSSEGEVETHKVEESDDPYYCLPNDSERIKEIDSGDFNFTEVRMLSYFDNLLWIRERVNYLYCFKPKFEVYLPKKDRTYGYYHMPVLYGDRLVARIEPKMDRLNKVLIIRGYWKEEGFKPTEDFEDKMHRTLESFASFNGATEVKWSQ
jgi:uncharacterized protein YcaQ